MESFFRLGNFPIGPRTRTRTLETFQCSARKQRVDVRNAATEDRRRKRERARPRGRKRATEAGGLAGKIDIPPRRLSRPRTNPLSVSRRNAPRRSRESSLRGLLPTLARGAAARPAARNLLEFALKRGPRGTYRGVVPSPHRIPRARVIIESSGATRRGSAAGFAGEAGWRRLEYKEDRITRLSGYRSVSAGQRRNCIIVCPSRGAIRSAQWKNRTGRLHPSKTPALRNRAAGGCASSRVSDRSDDSANFSAAGAGLQLPIVSRDTSSRTVRRSLELSRSIKPRGRAEYRDAASNKLRTSLRAVIRVPPAGS